MHELSIVMSISDIAEQEVRKAKAKSVERIELEIGTMAGIEFNSLDFAWGPGTKGTVLEQSERIIHKIQAEAECGECGSRFPKENVYDPCPKCEGYFHEMLSGKELLVKRLILKTD